MKRVLTSLIALLVLGCAASESPAPAKMTPASALDPDYRYLFPKLGENGDPACPMGLPGVNVSSIPTDRGVMLVFTADQGVHAVRKRAALMARTLSAEPVFGIEAEADYREVPSGATVEVMAEEPEQALGLSDGVEGSVREMQTKRVCPDGLLAKPTS